MAWIKETDTAIYLMDGGYWVSRLSKYPSQTNSQEKVLNVAAIQSWFTGPDPPRSMVVSPGSPEPPPISERPPSPSTASGRTGSSGLDLIKHFEGLRLTAYRDPVGVWTIGYGHTAMAGPPPVTSGMTISAAEAETILKRDLGVFEAGVTESVTVPVTQDMFDALVSFSFNVGLGNLRSSTLLRKLNSGDYTGAANEFPRWVYAGGVKLAGLVRRRNAEQALFLSQNYRAYFN